MINIVNLTPHSVQFQRADGTLTDPIPPAPQPAWVASRDEEHAPINDIPVRRQVRSGVTGLPEPQPNTIYIVSSVVATALLEEGTHRNDVYVPVDIVRNEKGQPAYARGLAQLVMAASPRNAAADAIIRIAEMVLLDERDYPAGLELLEVAARVRRGSIPDFRGVRMELTTLKRDPAASAQFRREIRAALETLRRIEDAYVADVQKNPPADQPCGECGGTGREVFIPTA